MRFVCLALAALALAVPASAQQRSLPVPAGKGWQHGETGLILTARLDGLERTSLTDTTISERDVAASFDNADRSVEATIYIFHPAITSVPLWFDRIETVIRDRDLFGGITPAGPSALAFVPPTGGPASALRRVYAPAKGPFRATGAAVIPLGDWLVAIRMSAKTLGPAGLDDALSRVIAAIRWPGVEGPPSPVAVPVTACTTPLPASRAKPVKREASSTMMDSLLGIVAASARQTPAARPLPPATWCREGAGTATYGVYRAGGAGYSIALADAGRSVSVMPSIATQIDPKAAPRISVLLTDVDGTTSTFDSFDRLPLPQQVVDLVLHGGPSSRSSPGAGR